MVEVQDVFKEYGKEYMRKHKIPFHHVKAINDIGACRTSLLGGHVDECGACGHIRISYNSCRNRHCPKCQSLSKEKWIEVRKTELLPVQYFHVVFTIPEEINAIALRNQKEVYSIFFKAVSETLLELSRDNKYLGAEIGFNAILHTWGQNLMYHPHIHCVVPGGGLSLDNKKWINSKKKFFIPVRVLSKKFKGKFLFYLKKLYYDNKLNFVGTIKDMSERNLFEICLSNLYKKEWVVYCKPPFKNAQYVIEYVGRYTHRVAISNERIVNVENGYVTFKWRDYKDNNKTKFMTVTSEEFIRRFLLHVLPYKFVKIRHYGILSNRNRITKLKTAQKLTGMNINKINNDNKKLTTEELILKLTGVDLKKCPCCEKGLMQRKSKLNPENGSPPANMVKTSY